MDERGESSSSYKFSPTEVNHAPVTPDKMGRPDPNLICKNQLENPFEEDVFEQISCWDGGFGSTSQSYRSMFSMDDVETWNSISCRDLLALADGGFGFDGGWLNGFDSSPPVAEPLIITGFSQRFTPLTPDQTKRVTVVEGNQDPEKRLDEKTNLNETPQSKQKRRKHRPKVVTEGKPKRGRKPASPKPEGSSTGKRKYVRRKGVEKPTETPAVQETSGIMDPNIDQQTKKTCKRKIDFDEVVQNYRKVHEAESPSVITPSKTELPQGKLKRNYTKAKCKIDFLQENHDKGLSHASSLYHDHLGYYLNTRCESIYDIDVLVNRFERLHINGDVVVPYMSRYHGKNALVVYQHDRSLVPYEGFFNPVRKRKQRPKVHLDDETNRVWMLLLEDINSKGIDGTDEDKAKWWEEERRVFRGRVDSFIARMHLVQGDRRFSPWKGSILDSVVGVFLTQNVSDHLSSSAFMALAARYPLKPNTSNEPCHEEESILSVKEPCQVDELGDRGPVTEADSCDEKEVVNSNEIAKNCVISVDLDDSSECEVAESSEKNSAICKESVINHIEVDEIVSSQNSADTCSTDITEEQKDGCKASILHMQAPTRVYEREVIQKISEKCASEESGISAESTCQPTVHMVNTSSQDSANSDGIVQQVIDIANEKKEVDFHLNKNERDHKTNGVDEGFSKVKKEKTGKTEVKVDWDKLRLQAEDKQKRERTRNTMDSMDYEAIRAAHVNDVANAIKERGMNNRLAARIKDMLDRLVRDHGSMDLEWLRDVPPDKAKEYLLSIKGLGLKSVECIRLLTLHHLAFPVDTNVGRIAVRLGWVPLQQLPESLQLHLLELYPIQDTIQKYLWPRLCKLDQRTLYELHYQMITFGKVFCTKTKPNCNACPLRGECRHFASAFASARLALPAPDGTIADLTENKTGQNPIGMIDLITSSSEQPTQLSEVQNCNPVIEEPTTPEPEQIQQVFDIEDFSGDTDTEEIPMIKLNVEAFTQNLQTYMERNMELGEGDMSKALVALTTEATSMPTPKLKNVSQLRTEHQVYELPDSHPLLEGLDTRELDDPCAYLLAIWTPGETADSIQPPQGQCCSQESGTLCNEETCFFCSSTREANSQTVRGTLLIPCRTAMRGSFPLNGTYFQVNEVFADHDSSLNPIDVPRAWLWNLPRRTVYFGTSVPTIFKGMTTEDIQYCFWKGFVCVRGFDQKTRAPRPLMARLHFPVSRLNKTKPKINEKEKLKQ